MKKSVSTTKVRASRRVAPRGSAPLHTTAARYKDLLHRLGCCSHDGAVKEITSLRQHAGLDKPNARHSLRYPSNGRGRRNPLLPNDALTSGRPDHDD